MTDVLVGIDAGGTKCAVRVETLDGVRIAGVVFDADDWAAEPPSVAARWLRERADRAAADHHIVGIGVGAQGCDSAELAAELSRELSALGSPAVVVNDAALLVPAAGLDDGIGVIAGTGSIAVGTTSDGEPVAAGGWGWVIGDEGGGAALVREATKAALSEHDAGEPDDGLLDALLKAFEVADAERLARAVNDDPSIPNWAPKAPAVFHAADGGSALAASVIDDAAASLALLVDRVVARGAVGSTVVAAGSVVVSQPRLYDGLRARVLNGHPGYETVLLDDDPVAGGITLARRIAG
ncbi:MAG: N-acetylglucosamine kinase [Humibacter sp.]